MDVNICSRRVHDGYATIRSRGRPRAVYRSDSEELLKEADGPYALPRLSNFQVIGEDARQVPRWSDLGRDQPPIENYGTLRVARSRDLEEPRRVMKTFSKKEKLDNNSRNSAPLINQRSEEKDKDRRNCETGSDRKKDYQANPNFCDHYGWKPEDKGHWGKDFRTDDRQIYDTVPTEDDPTILKPFCVFSMKTSQQNGLTNIGSNQYNVLKNYKVDVENLNNHTAKNGKDNYIFKNNGNICVKVESDKRTRTRDLRNARNDILKDSADLHSKSILIFKNERKSHDLENTKRRISCKNRGQPIYAVPNVFSKSRRERRTVIVDGNYVPSGDLYRTTAKYIEDINRNLAEIDKSYEELKTNPRTYGVINRITKCEFLSLQDQSCDLFSYAKKRDMVPMPPIIGVDIDDITVEERNEKEKREMSSRNKYLRRPNSQGKLPPKVLPRSSSMENTSRHSTGSTTASSSKSTESLYAISESLTELPRAEIPREQSNPAWNENSKKINSLRKEKSQNLPKSNSDMLLKKTNRIIKHNNEVKGSESKDEMSSTDDDISIPKKSLDMSPPVTNVIRRNRSRVDREVEKPLLKKEQDLNIVSEKIPSKLERIRSLENHPKDRRYDTLPSRKPRISLRSLHKSSEDVLDGEKISHEDSGLPQRSYSNTTDISYRQNIDKDLAEVRQGPIYTMDATEVILKGQIERSDRSQRQDRLPRTRHNSLEFEEGDSKVQYSGFATLPRRGNFLKGQLDPLRRFSGNGPILEPLYEHAVSDPVKPRGNQNVIPWWELATRKYRHRSCPSLQVNSIRTYQNGTGTIRIKSHFST